MKKLMFGVDVIGISPDASSLINNVVTKNADVYSYTYRCVGYLVKANTKVASRALTPIYYNYILK